MRHIHKTLVVDESNHPIAVQIGYDDWLEIESALEVESEKKSTASLQYLSGTLVFPEDPLAYQLRVRGEWS